MKEKEREKGREKEGVSELLPLFYRRSDGRSSSGQELKSIYSMRCSFFHLHIKIIRNQISATTTQEVISNLRANVPKNLFSHFFVFVVDQITYTNL